MDGRQWNSGYSVSVDGGRTQVWMRSIREVTRLFNQAGLTISASTVHAIQSQRDDLPLLNRVRTWRPRAAAVRVRCLMQLCFLPYLQL